MIDNLPLHILINLLHGNELLDALVPDQRHVVRICSRMRPQLLGLGVVHTAHDYPRYASSSFPSRVAAATAAGPLSMVLKGPNRFVVGHGSRSQFHDGCQGLRSLLHRRSITPSPARARSMPC